MQRAGAKKASDAGRPAGRLLMSAAKRKHPEVQLKQERVASGSNEAQSQDGNMGALRGPSPKRFF